MKRNMRLIILVAMGLAAGAARADVGPHFPRRPQPVD